MMMFGREINTNKAQSLLTVHNEEYKEINGRNNKNTKRPLILTNYSWL